MKMESLFFYLAIVCFQVVATEEPSRMEGDWLLFPLFCSSTIFFLSWAQGLFGKGRQQRINCLLSELSNNQQQWQFLAWDLHPLTFFFVKPASASEALTTYYNRFENLKLELWHLNLRFHRGAELETSRSYIHEMFGHDVASSIRINVFYSRSPTIRRRFEKYLRGHRTRSHLFLQCASIGHF